MVLMLRRKRVVLSLLFFLILFYWHFLCKQGMLIEPKAVLHYKVSFCLTWFTESQKAEHPLQELALDVVKTHSYSPVHSGEGGRKGEIE